MLTEKHQVCSPILLRDPVLRPTDQVQNTPGKNLEPERLKPLSNAGMTGNDILHM